MNRMIIVFVCLFLIGCATLQNLTSDNVDNITGRTVELVEKYYEARKEIDALKVEYEQSKNQAKKEEIAERIEALNDFIDSLELEKK